MRAYSISCVDFDYYASITQDLVLYFLRWLDWTAERGAAPAASTLLYLQFRNTGVLYCLGRVDKMDSPPRSAVIQGHLYVGGDLGTQPDVGRRMGIL